MVTRSKIEVWQLAADAIGQTEVIQSEDDTSLAAGVLRRRYDDILKSCFEFYHWRFAQRQVVLASIASQATTYAYDASVSLTTFSIPHPFDNTSDVAVVKGSTTLVAGTDYNVLVGDPADETEDRIVLTSALVAGESVTVTVTVSVEGYDYVYALPSGLAAPIALIAEDERYELTPVEFRRSYDIRPRPGDVGDMLCTDYLIGTDFEVLEYTAVIETPSVWPRLFLDVVVSKLAELLFRSVAKDLKKAQFARQESIMLIDQARTRDLERRQRAPAPETPSVVARGSIPRRRLRGITDG